MKELTKEDSAGKEHKNPTVAIAKCKDYSDIDQAVEECLSYLGGISAFVKPQDKVLLKINQLYPKNKKYAVTTNPAIVAVVAKLVRAAGGMPSVGDSPAVASVYMTAKVSDIDKVCKEMDIPLINLDDPVLVKNPDGKLVKSFKISKKLEQFDLIINMPKLKTHMFTVMTGAVKNNFGCIPGRLKAGYHLRQQDPESFSQMLIDLNELIRPRLTIMDAVVAMEGQGPGSGDPTNTGLVIAGESTYAVDRVAAEIIGFLEKDVPTLYLAKRRGLFGSELNDIVIKGLPLKAAKVKKFKFAKSMYNPAPTFFKSVGRRLFTARPVCIEANCIGCGNCKTICAAKAITMEADRSNKKGSFGKNKAHPVFDYDKCIRCYCCHEICPEKAIKLKRGMFAGILE